MQYGGYVSKFGKSINVYLIFIETINSRNVQTGTEIPMMIKDQ